MKYLYELLSEIDHKVLKGNDDEQVTGISFDTNNIRPGNVFVCLHGARTDSHRYAKKAVSMGAAAIITEEDVDMSLDATVIRVNDSREALAVMSAAFFDDPARDMILVGITGTKGKTTTSYMIGRILSDAGFSVGIIGSMGISYCGRSYESDNTTPESYVIWETLHKMKKKGVRVVVMEVSSQGLKYKRVYGMKFDYGIFTNLSKDHIGTDEHPDMEDYINSKALLFRMCRHAIVNSSDPACERILHDNNCETITYFGSSGYMAGDIRYVTDGSFMGTEFTVRCPDTAYTVSLRMAGSYNVYNALAAIAVCDKIMYQDEDETRACVIADSLSDMTVNGRTELVDVDADFHVMIDYAHNEVSLCSLLRSVRIYKPARIICLFGCGGNRSKERRYNMGRVSAMYADITIITSDNPRYEDPYEIMNDIESGLLHILSKNDKMNKMAGLGGDAKRYLMIADRREAISHAVSYAKKGDLIIIAGKGHEAWQEINGRMFPFDDHEVVREALMQRGYIVK